MPPQSRATLAPSIPPAAELLDVFFLSANQALDQEAAHLHDVSSEVKNDTNHTNSDFTIFINYDKGLPDGLYNAAHKCL